MRDWLIAWAQQPLEVRLATVAMLTGGLGFLGLAGPRRVGRLGTCLLASGWFLLRWGTKPALFLTIRLILIYVFLFANAIFPIWYVYWCPGAVDSDDFFHVSMTEALALGGRCLVMPTGLLKVWQVIQEEGVSFGRIMQYLLPAVGSTTFVLGGIFFLLVIRATGPSPPSSTGAYFGGRYGGGIVGPYGGDIERARKIFDYEERVRIGQRVERFMREWKALCARWRQAWGDDP